MLRVIDEINDYEGMVEHYSLFITSIIDRKVNAFLSIFYLVFHCDFIHAYSVSTSPLAHEQR